MKKFNVFVRNTTSGAVGTITVYSWDPNAAGQEAQFKLSPFGFKEVVSIKELG